MKVVVNMESDEREVLGPFVKVEEDSVVFVKVGRSPDGGLHDSAPFDCVQIVEVTNADLRGHFDHFLSEIRSAKSMIGYNGDSVVAMNALVALAAEMNDYASAMGAVLGVDRAYSELRHSYKVGSRRGACAVKVEG